MLHSCTVQGWLFWTIVHCDLNDFDSSKGEHSIILSTCLDLTCLFRLSAQPLENSFPQWEQEKGVLLRVFILLIPPPPTPSHLPPYFPLVLLFIYLLTSSFSSSFFLFFALIPPQFSSWKMLKFKASEIVENASQFCQLSVKNTQLFSIFPVLFLHFAENLKSRDMTPTAGNS